jgi:hypothetical protein
MKKGQLQILLAPSTANNARRVVLELPQGRLK